MEGDIIKLDQELGIIKMVLGPLETNCYIITDSASREAVVIDPAIEDNHLWERIEKDEWHLKMILLTHGHYDHIAGVLGLSEKFDAGVWIHEADEEMFRDPMKNFSILLGSPFRGSTVEGYLKENLEISIGNSTLKIIHTPGHSSGSVSILGNGFVIAGDTLFRNSVGRADFPGASMPLLLESISKKLLILDDDIKVYPGHGDETTIGHERKWNPFLNNDQS
jgi:glyoxylase-like metal-dependent hydrolase (beta-lactamase superfamily II)